MAHQIIFRDDARRTFDRLDRAIQRQVEPVINRLAEMAFMVSAPRGLQRAGVPGPGFGLSQAARLATLPG